jgi:hypothetical protein
MAGEIANAEAATSAKMNLMVVAPVWIAAGSALGRDIRVANVSADLSVTKILHEGAAVTHTRKRLRENRCCRTTGWV